MPLAFVPAAPVRAPPLPPPSPRDASRSPPRMRAARLSSPPPTPSAPPPAARPPAYVVAPSRPPRPASPPTPADWLRANEAALRRRDAHLVRGKQRAAAAAAASAAAAAAAATAASAAAAAAAATAAASAAAAAAAAVVAPPCAAAATAPLPASRRPATAAMLNVAGGGRWLYASPPSYCSVHRDVATVVASLENKVFYLGPVTRNKVVRAVQLARAAAEVAGEVSPADAKRLSENVTVALIVADLQMDCETVCAAVVSGFVGRRGCSPEQVERGVGPDVLRILEFHREVAEKVKLCVDPGFTEMSFSNLRELILVGAMDEHRAISLELARAVLQIRTLGALAHEEHKVAVARRTMYLYAPLANQLGIWYVQGELEELAFMYLQPESYHMVRHLVGERRRECESTLTDSKDFLERILSTTPEVRTVVRRVLIKGRVKGLYSVYRKMRRGGKKVYEIYDLLALRVVVQPKRADEEAEVSSCYAVANVIKQHYETFESRAKDYIAAPKRNGYRSVHLTVVPKGGSTPLEIQVRTEKMHHVAEFGAAAHWIYKEKSSGHPDDDDLESDDHFMGDDAYAPEDEDALLPLPGLLDNEETLGESTFPPMDPVDSADPAASAAPVDLADPTDPADSSLPSSPSDVYKYNSTMPARSTSPTLLKLKMHPSAPLRAATTPCPKASRMDELRAGLLSAHRTSGGDMHDQLRKGYVACLASAIRASRVIVAAAGQLYGLAVGSTLLDLARGLGVASLDAIAVVNGSVAPLTQRLEMNDIVRFISALPET